MFADQLREVHSCTSVLNAPDAVHWNTFGDPEDHLSNTFLATAPGREGSKDGAT
jgi:hypothetical protein